METKVVYSTKPKLKNPILVEGLPGFGQVGRLAAEHLIKEFKGKKFAEVYSPHFPPQVMMRNDGFVEMITNSLYYVKHPKRDMILLVGEAQAATITGQYDICEKILDAVEELGCKEVVTVGGYATGKLMKEPSVFGAANSKKMISDLEKLGVTFKTKGNRGGIVGASGLLVGLSALRNIDAVCLMGETPGHPLLIDAKAAEKVLDVLAKHLNMKIEMGALEKRAKELEKFRLGLEKMMQKMVAEQQGQEEGTPPEEGQLKYIG
jgi:uncharacterized protein (TIGR00162 family)